MTTRLSTIDTTELPAGGAPIPNIMLILTNKGLSVKAHPQLLEFLFFFRMRLIRKVTPEQFV